MDQVRGLTRASTSEGPTQQAASSSGRWGHVSPPPAASGRNRSAQIKTARAETELQNHKEGDCASPAAHQEAIAAEDLTFGKKGLLSP